ncbi:hypothetical protein BD626DRAFT_523499 [Schizophyllum amplum]|uniref:MYND-type domain-containing protein n=1 Tax=Schizophyllum amplum TaxID=97359 RepID=A0A550BSX4_9AGAR|nr:hypothetical protein BD626DRAFT_523499 [Auriculariopsis ampla]
MPFEPEGFTDARIAHEYRTLCVLGELANGASTEQPVYTEINHQSALTKIIDLLDDNDSLAFFTLVSDPPSGALAYDSDLVSLIIISFNIVTTLSDAARFPHDRRLDLSLRSLWPHVVKWSALLHPARGRLIRAPGPRDVRRSVTAIVQLYLRIFQSPDVMYFKSFLHGNPDAVSQAFELWLRFPHYCSKSGQESTTTVHGAITLFVVLSNVLLGNDATVDDCALFADELLLTLGDLRTLYRAISRQTSLLAKLTTKSAIIRGLWSNHFTLLTRCLCLCLQRCPERPPIPKKVIVSTVSAAMLCVKIQAPADAASRALGLLTALCRTVSSNHPLARAIDAGVFDLLHDLGRPADMYDITDFAQQLSAGLFHPRVSRVLLRRHPNVPYVAPSPARVEPGHIPDWQDVALLWSMFLKPYIEAYDSRSAEMKTGWRYAMTCTNHHGPHNELVRVCPCAGAFYCSGSCRKMHRSKHREVCDADQGPWGLNGAITLDDAIFTCTIARGYISCQRGTIGAQIASLGCPLQEVHIIVLIDLYDVLPIPRHTLETCPKIATSYFVPSVVVVDVLLRIGAARARHHVPFVYNLKYFYRT